MKGEPASLYAGELLAHEVRVSGAQETPDDLQEPGEDVMGEEPARFRQGSSAPVLDQNWVQGRPSFCAADAALALRPLKVYQEINYAP